MRFPLLFIFIFFILGNSSGQNELLSNKPIDGIEAIKLLSKGTLIVRLSNQDQRIEHVGALEGKEKAQQEKNGIDQSYKDMIKEFEKDYSFSDLVFAHEVELYEYLNDKTRSVFLTNDLKVDSSIQIKNGPIFILASHEDKIYELYDENYIPIGKPAPRYSNIYYNRSYQFFITKLVQSISKLFIRKITVEKFNEKLYKNIKNPG